MPKPSKNLGCFIIVFIEMWWVFWKIFKKFSWPCYVAWEVFFLKAKWQIFTTNKIIDSIDRVTIKMPFNVLLKALNSLNFHYFYLFILWFLNLTCTCFHWITIAPLIFFLHLSMCHTGHIFLHNFWLTLPLPCEHGKCLSFTFYPNSKMFKP
jgi:hypothetical protein